MLFTIRIQQYINDNNLRVVRDFPPSRFRAVPDAAQNLKIEKDSVINKVK